MNSDLISRSELKKHKFTTQQANGVEIEDIDVVPLACIDNAPAIDTNDIEYKAYCRGLEAGKRLVSSQGVWLYHSEDGYVECPICGHLTNCEDNIDELHYCWNCGAKIENGGMINDNSNNNT